MELPGALLLGLLLVGLLLVGLLLVGLLLAPVLDVVLAQPANNTSTLPPRIKPTVVPRVEPDQLSMSGLLP